jgi:hypothetical protein
MATTTDWKQLAPALWARINDNGALVLSDRDPNDTAITFLRIPEAEIEHLVDYLNVELGIEPKNAPPPTSSLQDQIARVEQEVFGWDEEHPAIRGMLGDAATALGSLMGDLDAITKHVAALQETMNTLLSRKPEIPDGLASRDWVEGRLSTLSAALRTFFKSELAKREMTLSDRARLAWRAMRGQPIANADGTRAAGYTPEQVSALGVEAAAAVERARAEKGGSQ